MQVYFQNQNEGNKELMFVVRAEPLADYGNHTYANILPGDYASPSGNIVEGWSGHRMPWGFYDTFDEMTGEENFGTGRIYIKVRCYS